VHGRLAKRLSGPQRLRAKAVLIASESRWLALAENYEFQDRLSFSPDQLPRHGASETVTRIVRQSGVSLEPNVITLVTFAYRAVLRELRLHDHEDAATSMVAKEIVDLAAQGERNPERLKTATLNLLTG
jgi:hypothetical protein